MPPIHCATLAAAFFLLLAGCHSVPDFPRRPAQVQPLPDGSRIITFDTRAPGPNDYQQVQSSAGRKLELRYHNLPDPIQLDQLDPGEVPHFIIILDGVPFPLVQQLYQAGHFRLFFPPSRLISSFPSSTDLAFSRIFNTAAPVSYEAEYFDRSANRLMPGNRNYLAGINAEWADHLDYRCSVWLDAVAYVWPQLVFDTELRGMDRLFRSTDQPTAWAYSVATAGLGTRSSGAGIIKYLREIDRFCEQIVQRRRGRVKITLFADHGHNLTGWQRISYARRLKKAGYRPAQTIETPRDVVIIEYGLMTNAVLHTDDPAGVADCLLQDAATELACYPAGDGVIVRDLTGRAVIRHRSGSFSYQAESGDPLGLAPIMAELNQGGLVDRQGYVDDRVLFDATVEHVYPDPLSRIWSAFHGLVQHRADLIVTLHDGYYHGWKFYDQLIGGARSTHGSLNQANSTSFVLTMRGRLPAALRLEDLLPALGALSE